MASDWRRVLTTQDDSDYKNSSIVVGDIPSGINATNIGDGTVSTAEFQYLNTVSSNIQNQLNGKQASGSYITSLSDLSITSTATEINKLAGFTGAAADLNYAKDLNSTGVTMLEFDYLDGVSSNIQTQLDDKQARDDELTELARMSANTASALTDLTQSEVQILDGATVTTAQLNRVDATSSIQTQLDAKQATITGAATTIDDANLTADRAVISSASGKVAVSAVTATELGFLDGVTSAIQTQLNGKEATISASNRVNATEVGTGIVNNTEFNYLNGVTSAIQTQLNGKATEAYVTNAITDLIDGAPDALNTLDELALALGDNENYAASITTALNARVSRQIDGDAPSDAPASGLGTIAIDSATSKFYIYG